MAPAGKEMKRKVYREDMGRNSFGQSLGSRCYIELNNKRFYIQDEYHREGNPVMHDERGPFTLYNGQRINLVDHPDYVAPKPVSIRNFWGFNTRAF